MAIPFCTGSLSPSLENHPAEIDFASFLDNLSSFGMVEGKNSPLAVMTSEFKRYFATIGRRGGRATSAQKGSAVRINGAKGGRPRKDGMPPGSKPLEQVIEGIQTSRLTRQAKLDLILWARATPRLFKDGQLWLNRADLIKITSVIGPGFLTSPRNISAPLHSNEGNQVVRPEAGIPCQPPEMAVILHTYGDTQKS